MQAQRTKEKFKSNLWKCKKKHKKNKDEKHLTKEQRDRASEREREKNVMA